jgi:hypothetical protein
MPLPFPTVENGVCLRNSKPWRRRWYHVAYSQRLLCPISKPTIGKMELYSFSTEQKMIFYHYFRPQNHGGFISYYTGYTSIDILWWTINNLQRWGWACVQTLYVSFAQDLALSNTFTPSTYIGKIGAVEWDWRSIISHKLQLPLDMDILIEETKIKYSLWLVLKIIVSKAVQQL